MNKKGQTAFEALFLFIVVTSAAIFIASLYTGIGDDTIAMSIARAETNKQLAIKNENILIEQISIEKTGQDATITIKLSENTTIDPTPITNSILKQTALKSATILITS